MQARQSGDRTHAHSFHHQFQNAGSRIQIRVVRAEPFDRLREGSFAGLATPALDAALTEVTELFALLVLAFYAGHIHLCFLADVALKSAWVGIAGHSACRLPRLSVSADGGVLFNGVGAAGIEPATYGFKVRCSPPIELRTHKGDVQGLAPSNVPVLNATCRTSDRHVRLPFAWIEHLKSSVGPLFGKPGPLRRMHTTRLFSGFDCSDCRCLLSFYGFHDDGVPSGFPCIQQIAQTKSFLVPLISPSHSSGLKRNGYFFNLLAFFHSLESGVYRGKQVSLRRETKGLHPITHFGRQKRFFSGPKHHPTGISKTLYQPGNRAAIVIHLGKFI